MLAEWAMIRDRARYLIARDGTWHRLEKEVDDGIHPLRKHGIEGEPTRARLHELRRPDHSERSPVGAHRRQGPALLPAGRRTRRDVLGHRERVSTWYVRRDRRPCGHSLLPHGGHRARD